MPPVRFKPTISAGERPQTYALDRAATGTGTLAIYSEERSLPGRLLYKQCVSVYTKVACLALTL